MPIPFDEIQAGNLVPSSLTEVTSAGASGSDVKRVLIVGQRNTGFTSPVAALTVFPVGGETSGESVGGAGSPLGSMCRAFKKLSRTARVEAMAVEDDGSGVVATGEVEILGTATAAGEIAVRIGGRLYRVGVPIDMPAADALDALKAAIDADLGAFVTAGAVASDAVPLTAKWKGPTGNDVAIVVTSTSVPGLTVTPTAMASGATPPDYSAAIAALPDEQIDTLVIDSSDPDTIAAFVAEAARRFEAGVEMDVVVYTAYRDDLAGSLAYAADLNSKHLVVVATGEALTVPWIWAAQAAARDTGMDDPGLPRVDLTLPDCIGPVQADRFTTDERQQLLAAGLATCTIGNDGTVRTERLVTTYKLGAGDVPDATYRDVTTMRIIADYRKGWKAVTTPWRAYKLVSDGTPLKPGVRAITPSYAAAAMDAYYEAQASTGNVEDVEGFKANRIAERDATDRNRLNTFHPINVGNFVVTVASKLQVTL